MSPVEWSDPLRHACMGNLGPEQLAWLADDLTGKSASTPIVVFAHVPLWTIATDWGWGTQDSAEALQLARPLWFGHSAERPLEGNVDVPYGALDRLSAAGAGTAPAPGSKLVSAASCTELLGITRVAVRRGGGLLAIADSSLAD